jgi:hypothetical protein
MKRATWLKRTSKRAVLKSGEVSPQGTKRDRELVNVAPLQLYEEALGRSRPLLLAEFLKSRIIPERIEHGIEPEQRRSKRHV